MLFSALRQRDDHLVALSPEKRHNVWQEEARGRAVLHGGGRDHHRPGQAPAHARQRRSGRRAGGKGAQAQTQTGILYIMRTHGDTLVRNVFFLFRTGVQRILRQSGVCDEKRSRIRVTIQRPRVPWCPLQRNSPPVAHLILSNQCHKLGKDFYTNTFFQTSASKYYNLKLPRRKRPTFSTEFHFLQRKKCYTCL